VRRATLTGLDPRRLRLALALFFLALAVPTAFLVRQAYTQLKWEAFHQQQALAEELARRIDGRLRALIAAEEGRSFADYGFLVVAGDPAASFVQRSPLSAFPVASAIPGVLGHFQVDARGTLTTPLLPPGAAGPAAYGITPAELASRRELAGRIARILGENRLVQGEGGRPAPPAAEAAGGRAREPAARRGSTGLAEMEADTLAAPSAPAPAQAAFDRLKDLKGAQDEVQRAPAAQALGRVEDLNLDYRYQSQGPAAPALGSASREGVLAERRAVRKERSNLPEAGAPVPAPAERAKADRPSEAMVRVMTFESEIDPFEASLLESGELVLFRKVWRDGQRYIQGVLIALQPFLDGVVGATFREASLSRASDLIVAYRDQVYAAFPAQAPERYLTSSEDLSGAVLYQTRLSAPLGEVELIFSVKQLPAGPGAGVVAWLAGILAVVLCAGVYLMYRLGLQQIALARQQQDFVSAVSHELNTPLTSIRMYGEILREGWAPEDKKHAYYEFILAESERLSRLISNVLQLARMSRNALRVDLRPTAAAELLEGVRPKLASQTERAGFALNVDCEEGAAGAIVRADADLFAQILINLVDNAIKFSARAERKAVDLGCRRVSGDRVLFTVRDYGPGVPRDQMKLIFALFYRAGDALTRETVGTGIGLALVRELAHAMGGEVDVVNREPGAEFRVSLPVIRTQTLAVAP